VTIELAIPGRDSLEIDHLVLDVNGTLSDRGGLIDGVAAALEELRGRVEPLLVSADTFGTLSEIGGHLGVASRAVQSGRDKLELVEELGASSTIVIGNGTNDAAALEAAALGIVVLGPEGTSVEAVRSADILCRSAVEALELLLDPKALAATLRG
jgi:P-type E1-E2 ATPase